MMIYFLFAWIAMVGAAVAQLFMKLGARATMHQKSVIVSMLNWQTILGYIIMIAATFASMYSLREVPLRDYAYILPTTFILVPVLSYFVLKEKIHKQYIIGTALILVGIVIFNL